MLYQAEDYIAQNLNYGVKLAVLKMTVTIRRMICILTQHEV